MIDDLNTFLTKVIPDTRLTIEKYADAKFEYLVRYRDSFKVCSKISYDLFSLIV